MCKIPLLLFLLVLPVRQAAPVEEKPHVYVVGHGWHVGIAIPRAFVEPGSWPEADTFASARFLEVGWGDAGYYPAEDPGLWTTLRAALWPTPAVLHVAGLRESLNTFFPRSEIVRLEVSSEGLDALVQFVRGYYARDEGGQVEVAAPGLYGTSLFYRAAGRYHLLNNSNPWAARALRAAGLPISPTRALTAGGLLRQAREAGQVIRQAP